MTRSTEADAEREKVRADLSRANELLSGLKIEIRVLESRRDDVREGIEAEARKLRQERERELEGLVAAAEAAIAPLEATRRKMNVEISTLSRQLIALESDHAGLEGQILAERATLGQITKEVSVVRSDKEKAENALVSVSAQITKLTANVKPLGDELATLGEEIRVATAKRDEVDREVVALQTIHQARKQELGLVIVGLERKRNELATTLTAEASTAKQEREALTLWAKKLEEQDKIIRAREYKVSIAEQKIMDNVGLLNL